MLTRCAALARGVEKDDVVTREAGLHRESSPRNLRNVNIAERSMPAAEFDIPGDTTGPLQSGWPVLSLHRMLYLTRSSLRPPEADFAMLRRLSWRRMGSPVWLWNKPHRF